MFINGQGKQALPYYDAQTGVQFGLIDYTFGTTGNIIISYYDGSTTLQKPSSSTYVYLKIIPSTQIKPNVDHTNYEEVIDSYEL